MTMARWRSGIDKYCRTGIPVRWFFAWIVVGLFVVDEQAIAADVVQEPVLSSSSLLRIPPALQQAMSIAIRQHPKTEAAHSQLAAAELIMKGSDYRWFPTLAGGLKSGVRAGERALSLSMKQPILDGGRIEGERDYALADVQASNAYLIENSDDIRQRTLLAYVSIMRAREMLGLAENNVEECEQAYQSISNRLTGGLGIASDLTMVKSRLLQGTASVNQWRGELKKVITMYVSIVGEQPPSEMGSIERLPPPTISEATLLSKLRSPVLHRFRAKIETARAESRMARAQLSPTLSGYISRAKYLGNSSYVDTLNQTSDRWSVGLNLEWQSNVSLSLRYQADSAARKVDAAINAADTAELDLEEQVATSWNDLVSATDREASLQEAVKAADDTLKQFRGQFSLGRRSWTDVVNSLSDAYNVKVQATEAKYSALVAASKLAIYMGQFDD